MEEVTCKNCGTLLDLFEYEDDQTCRSCGFVDDAPILVNGDHQVPSFTQYSHRNNHAAAILLNHPRPHVSLTHGQLSLKNLCHAYNVPAKTEKEISELLNRAYKSKKRHRCRDDVAVLAGCCMFLVQKNDKEDQVTITDICRHLGCTKAKFSATLKHLKNWLSESNQFLSDQGGDENQIFVKEQYNNDYSSGELPEATKNLIKVVCGNGPDENSEQLVKKTTELVKLSYSCWVLTGRQPSPVVIACCFICWKSMHATERNTFSDFCTLFNIQEPLPAARRRVCELRKLLLLLGQKIPSYTSNYVTKYNVLFHLDTILENSESLRNDLLGEEFFEQDINLKEYATFRIVPKRKPRIAPTTSVVYNEDMNASDIEISDSEIDSYIINDKLKQTIENVCEKKAMEIFPNT